MSRVYIAVPVDPAHAAEGIAEALAAYRESAEEHAERGYTGPPRVIRLRDRTGPSVAERLATVEERTILMGARMAQFEGHPVAGGAGIVERLAALESDLLDLRTRVGDSVASPPATTDPTPEQIEAYLRGMRARILGASSATPSGPAEDRLAKVAEPTDDDLLNLFERAEYASGDTRAARRALYDLGREHGRAEREVAPTPHVPDGETRDRPATLTAAEMAAELREAGWSEGSGWRSPRDTLFAWHRYTADAYAAMRAAKGAK
jgi:hypothetical protein